MNILFFVHPGTNSRSVLLDLRAGFEHAGHRTFVWEAEPLMRAQATFPQAAQPIASAFTLAFERFLTSNAIDICMGMWANAALAFVQDLDANGHIRTAFDRARVPLMCYWYDAPFWAHEGKFPEFLQTPQGQSVRSHNLFHVVNNAGTALEMSRVLGLKNVIPMPYGIDPRAFTPDQDAPREFDIVFSYGPGDPPPSPLMLEQLDLLEPNVRAIRTSVAESLSGVFRELVTRFPAALHEQAAELIRFMTTLQLERRDTPMLLRIDGLSDACSHLRSAIDHLLSDLPLYTELGMTLRRIENWERAFTYSYLSRHFKCASFGQGDPDAWHAEGTHLGPLDMHQQSKAYSRGHIGLNVMRWQDDIGLNVKPYEITASGAALLCARRTGLEDQWILGKEALAFTTPAEARQVAAQALQDPDALHALANAGRQRTLQDHTWTSVAGRLASIINDHEQR